MKGFIKALGLNQINNYYYHSPLSGGKAATTCIYKNDSGQEVVVKFLIAPRNEQELDRFEAEFKALQMLQSSVHFPKLLSGFVKHNNYPIYYFLMEMIYGDSLEKHIESKHLPWDWRYSVEMLHRISSALSESLIIFVHRDLHPGNIILHKEPQFDKTDGIYIDSGIRILDFGCNKDTIRELFGLWQETNFRHLGAVRTWSPEFLFSPSTVGREHDIWALGVMFYRFLTGLHPIDAKSFGELIKKTTAGKIEWSCIEDVGLPLTVQLLCKALLVVDPKKRFLTRGITKVCNEILNTGLNTWDQDKIHFYFSCEGDIWICPCCRELVRPFRSRCPNCGRMFEGFDWISPLQ